MAILKTLVTVCQMVTNQQVRRLFDVRNKHDHLYQAADAAGMSSKTARKYLKNGKLPSQCKIEHTWPTRQDPFADDWVFIEQTLIDTHFLVAHTKCVPKFRFVTLTALDKILCFLRKSLFFGRLYGNQLG